MSATIAEPPKHRAAFQMAPVLLLPITFGMNMIEGWTTVTDSWLQMVFSPAHHHGHGHHCDLEVPDPIEDAGEHDLFA